MITARSISRLRTEEDVTIDLLATIKIHAQRETLLQTCLCSFVTSLALSQRVCLCERILHSWLLPVPAVAAACTVLIVC